MCGIAFVCSRSEHVELDDATRHALRARGPDSYKFYHARSSSSRAGPTNTIQPDGDYHLTFGSSVLSLRGQSVCVQPLIDPTTGSVLCWNGEAWRINGTQVCGNDTDQVFKLLLDALASTDDDGISLENSPYKISNVLTRVIGPYAFVYYDATTSIVYYGRDRLGRRSLVINSSISSTAELTISSLSLTQQPAVEVTTDGIHYIDLKEPNPAPKCLPWSIPGPVLNKGFPNHHDHISPLPSRNAVTALMQSLSEAIRVRVLDVPTYTTYPGSLYTTPSRVAILFSGGLDCTLLARIAHDIIPIDQPVDLLNVAFENPRTVRAASQSKQMLNHADSPKSPYETCPDRITARSSFSELVDICGSRTWRFVAIDVPYSETIAHRSTVIKLMAPHNTEMDLSITLALYFASRGQGHSITNPSSESVLYTTTSRVLLSGLGADELFGGYARHAAALNRAGYDGLNDELELDFSRIGTRNLGRDDRVMAHWGREVRYPYLDEDFVKFALALPAWEKVGFRPGKKIPKHFEGSGERILVEKEEDLDPAKMLLRLAAWKLGMKSVAGEKKRAIQFGARTAKMEGGRTKGTDVLDIA